MGLGGVTDADPRFRNVPFPEPQFTEWGAVESRRLASPNTPGECNPWSPVMFMGGGGLFPIQILQGPNVIVIHHEAVTQVQRHILGVNLDLMIRRIVLEAEVAGKRLRGPANRDGQQ